MTAEGGAGPAVLGEEMRLPDKRLSSDEGSPEGPLARPVEPAAMTPLPAQSEHLGVLACV